METRRYTAVDELYKEEAMLFSQAIHSNACDCLLLNNLEMYEVMLSLCKNALISHDGSENAFF